MSELLLSFAVPRVAWAVEHLRCLGMNIHDGHACHRHQHVCLLAALKRLGAERDGLEDPTWPPELDAEVFLDGRQTVEVIAHDTGGFFGGAAVCGIGWGLLARDHLNDLPEEVFVVRKRTPEILTSTDLAAGYDGFVDQTMILAEVTD